MSNPQTNNQSTQQIPVIGWQNEDPVPHSFRFNSYLEARNGRLFMENIDLVSLLTRELQVNGAKTKLPSPLEIIYLPLIRRQIKKMNDIFEQAIAEVDYKGRFIYAYASKANAAEEVVRTTLGSGAHHEMSSTVDVEIARLMIERGLLPQNRFIICNGFKSPGSIYAENILRLHDVHPNIIPVIEDIYELNPLIASGKKFDVGIRQKTYGPNLTEDEMEAANSRFGLDLENVWKAVDYIAAAPNLNLRLYHAMVGSQITDKEAFIEYLKPSIDVFARLRKKVPGINIFDFGGGMPVQMTLNFSFDYQAFAVNLLQTIKETCARYGVLQPDIMGEFGRYTTAEHGAHLFKVNNVKDNGSELPWYIIDGSIMSSFPDTWCLGEHFICLPLNNLDRPFQQVQLGGLTCDSDDVYPPKKSQSPLFMPIDADELYIGFFAIGAYQEMLGGVKGSKHCVIPEAYELLIDKDRKGNPLFQVIRGQTPEDVLQNLGY